MKRRDLLKVVAAAPLLAALPCVASAVEKTHWIPNDGKFYIVSAADATMTDAIVKHIAEMRGFCNIDNVQFDKRVEFPVTSEWKRFHNEIVVYKGWKEFNEAIPSLIVPSLKLRNAGLSGNDSPSRALFLQARDCIGQKHKLVAVDSNATFYRQTHIVLDNWAYRTTDLMTPRTAWCAPYLLHPEADGVASLMSDDHFVQVGANSWTTVKATLFTT